MRAGIRGATVDPKPEMGARAAGAWKTGREGGDERLMAVLPTGHFQRLFWGKWHFLRHRAFSFVDKNAIKLGKNAPFLLIGHLSEALML